MNAFFVGTVFAHSSESMPEIPDGVVQCCVTSPPYFGLRRYDEHAVILRLSLTPEQCADVIVELEKYGIKPR